MKFYKIITIIMIFFFLVFNDDLLADRRGELDALGGPKRGYDYELEFIPPYCKPKMRTSLVKEHNRWRKKFSSLGKKGEDYVHCHHYCQALIAINRIKKNIGNRNAQIGEAEGGLLYMINHCRSDFILMPDILKHLVYIQNLKRDNDRAQYYFNQLKQLKKTKRD